jgi:hypothetical protein
VQSFTWLKSATSSSRRCSAVSDTTPRPSAVWPCSPPGARRARLRGPGALIRSPSTLHRAAVAKMARLAKGGAGCARRHNSGTEGCACRSLSIPRSAGRTPRTRIHRGASFTHRRSRAAQDAPSIVSQPWPCAGKTRPLRQTRRFQSAKSGRGGWVARRLVRSGRPACSEYGGHSQSVDLASTPE